MALVGLCIMGRTMLCGEDLHILTEGVELLDHLGRKTFFGFIDAGDQGLGFGDRHASVDQHTRIGMVDDVHVDRHPLTLSEQVGNKDWRDRDFLFHAPGNLNIIRGARQGAPNVDFSGEFA